MYRHSAHKPDGFLICTPHDGGPTITRDTIMCVHCNGHWVVIPGSGRKRDFCRRCMGPTCGPECPAGTGCVPWEQHIENMETGRPLDFVPIQVSVPADVPAFVSEGGILLPSDPLLLR